MTLREELILMMATGLLKMAMKSGKPLSADDMARESVGYADTIVAFAATNKPKRSGSR